MRTTWNGSISFSLVTIPVGLAPATKPAARASDIAFRQLHRECKSPIKNKRWCPVHEREVESDEIVKGWEVAKGQFVIVEDADLEAI
jgi:DNA end-binding protein Ku